MNGELSNLYKARILFLLSQLVHLLLFTKKIHLNFIEKLLFCVSKNPYICQKNEFIGEYYLKIYEICKYIN